METVYILSSVRTPMGSFGGSLKGFSAVQLGTLAIQSAIERAHIERDSVQEVFMGNVVSANLGQAPARQAALGAGIGHQVPCTTVNKVCSSGMKSIMFGAQAIQLGQADLIIAGGMESMTNIPYYVEKARWGIKYGHSQLIDGLAKDGLTDAYDHQAMGVCADRTASKYNISREAQDAFAIESYKKSIVATKTGKFKEEIIPIEIPQRRGDPKLLNEDEEIQFVNYEKIPKLKPVFTPDGTVTAANASTINDGASALVLCSEKFVKEHDVEPLARIISYADAAQEPAWFTTAPTLATPKALDRANLKVKDIDLYEVNEAFAVVPMAFYQDLEIDPSIINIHGGAVSLGHPLGASGARIVTTLVHALQQEGKSKGLATLCNGGGGASAIVIESLK